MLKAAAALRAKRAFTRTVGPTTMPLDVTFMHPMIVNVYDPETRVSISWRYDERRLVRLTVHDPGGHFRWADEICGLA